jgi:MFS family permease
MLATISDLFSGQRKQKVLGFYTLSSAVGVFLGPFIINLLLVVTDLRATFFVALMIELVVILFSFLRMRGFRFPYRPQTGMRRSIGRILSNKNIIGSTFALSTSVFALTAVTVFLPFFTDQRLGLDPAMVVTLFTIRSFALVSMRTLTVLRLQEKIGVKRLILVNLLLHLGISLIPVGQSYHELILPLLLSGIAHGTLFPTTAYIVSESAIPEERGLANAFYMLALDLVSFVGPLLLGLVTEKFSISLVFLIGAVAPLLGALVSFLTIKNK